MLNVDLSGKNKYYNLYLALRGEILSGRLKSGEKLPSKRAIAAETGVSLVTVRLALEQLLAEGYVRSVERSGYFVEEVNATASAGKPTVKGAENGTLNAETTAKKYRVDLVKGSIPAELFPFSTWAKLLRTVLADCGEHLLERVPCDGDAELKRQIAAYLYRARGISVDHKYIVIGAGAEHLYGVIVQLLGRNTLFAVENPGYGKISFTYKLHGASVLPVKVGTSGVDISQIENSGAQVAHVSPSHQFPTGAVMPAANRSRLIGWATGNGNYIVEDDYDSEFRLTGKPLQSMFSLCPERVIYMNTFSKSLAPSMRMGYMVLPPALYQKYISLFSAGANLVPLFEQKALAAMLGGGYFERHLSRLKNHYRTIRSAVLERLNSLNNCTVWDEGSGLHAVAKFTGLSSDEEIKSRARNVGINVKCLTDYLIAPQSGLELCAVINYSGLTEKNIESLKGLTFLG